VVAEPVATLREVDLRLAGLRDLFDERDRRYEERAKASGTAVDAALASVKEQTRANFEASEKAIVKAENAQREYNVRSNEFRGQLDDQAKRLISRTEVDSIVKNLEEKIGRLDTDIRGLRESRGAGAGANDAAKSQRDSLRANLAAVVGLVALGVVLWRVVTGH